MAAEAAGIGKSTFYRWLQRDESEARGIYHEFGRDIRQARAQARVAAEAEVRRDNPLAWLRYGPGRAGPGEPGWTDSHEVVTRSEGQSDPRMEALSDEQLERIIDLTDGGMAVAESASS
ncbi:MAG: hypothetical protein IT580_24535 [Verrucomicrobiales bacterium]|nr:hypothetical protein [Verrucomicrobiales bacterium]